MRLFILLVKYVRKKVQHVTLTCQDGPLKYLNALHCLELGLVNREQETERKLTSACVETTLKRFALPHSDKSKVDVKLSESR